MRTRKVINGLGAAGALIALVGVAVAANDALAADAETIEATAITTYNHESTRSEAEKAIIEAAADAATAVELGNTPGLDIPLIDHKSLVLMGGL